MWCSPFIEVLSWVPFLISCSVVPLETIVSLFSLEVSGKRRKKKMFLGHENKERESIQVCRRNHVEGRRVLLRRIG
jgi:hypothetical protein